MLLRFIRLVEKKPSYIQYGWLRGNRLILRVVITGSNKVASEFAAHTGKPMR